jgi:hypothetical protein
MGLEMVSYDRDLYALSKKVLDRIYIIHTTFYWLFEWRTAG